MKLLLSIAALTVILFACKKNGESGGNGTNYSKIFGRWYFVSYDKGTTHLNNSDPCLADNFIEFSSDTTGYTSQGLCMEDPSDPRDEPFGTWFFTAQDILDIGGDEVRILKLTNSDLWFRETTGTQPYEYHWKR